MIEAVVWTAIAVVAAGGATWWVLRSLDAYIDDFYREERARRRELLALGSEGTAGRVGDDSTTDLRGCGQAGTAHRRTERGPHGL